MAKRSRSFEKFEQWPLTREFLKQYLTEKQNGYYRSGRLREVVANRELIVISTNWLNDQPAANKQLKRFQPIPFNKVIKNASYPTKWNLKY